MLLLTPPQERALLKLMLGHPREPVDMLHLRDVAERLCVRDFMRRTSPLHVPIVPDGAA